MQTRLRPALEKLGPESALTGRASGVPLQGGLGLVHQGWSGLWQASFGDILGYRQCRDTAHGPEQREAERARKEHGPNSD